MFQVSPQFQQIQATKDAAAAVARLAEAVERLADHFCPLPEEGEEAPEAAAKAAAKPKRQSKARTSKKESEKELQNASTTAE